MTSWHPRRRLFAPKRSVGPIALAGNAGCILTAVLVTGATAGCDNCSRARPYTPFVAESALPEPPPIPAANPAAPNAVTDQPQITIEARRFEPPVGRFSIGGRSIELPKQTVAELSLEQDFDGDGRLDGLVWIRPEKADANWTGALASLWYFPTSGDARQLFDLPGFVPSGAGCNLDTKLRGLDAQFAWLEFTANCTTSLPQRTPIGARLLLAPASPKPVVLGLRVAQTAPGESLEIAPMVTDRDSDGRKDPAFSFTLNVAETRAATSFALGWLDRAAGASRDDAYFMTSVEARLKGWESRLSKKSKAEGLDRELEAFRRIISTVCQEAMTPRVWDHQGNALRCNLTSAARARLARIDVEQAMLKEDLGGALHAYSEANRWLGTIPTVELEGLRKRLAKSLRIVPTNLPVAVTTRPKPTGPNIRYSPLRFDADDSLLVQTDRGGIERVKLDGTNETVDLDATTPWSLDVVGADGRKWTGVVPACDRSELLLSYTASNGSITLQPTTLLAPRPGVCRSPARWPVATAPIAFIADRPLAIVDSVCLGPNGLLACQSPALLGAVTPGSPRSPDGRRLVFVSPLGPIVYGGAKPERWENAVFDTAPPTDCAVANDAKAIACVQAGKVVLVTRATAAP